MIIEAIKLMRAQTNVVSLNKIVNTLNENQFNTNDISTNTNTGK